MSKMQIECFKDGSEVTSFSRESGRFLTLSFNKSYNGFVTVGNVSARIVGSECTLDLSRLDDGIYAPKLVLCDEAISLPKIKKENGIILPCEHDLSSLREISLRERRLSQRVDALSEKIEKIYEKVFGTSIF